MKFTNKTYDVLKWIARFLLPASGTLYFGLAATWGLPYGEQVVGTITALTTFMNVILGISSVSYDKEHGNTPVGTLNVVREADDATTIQVAFDNEAVVEGLDGMTTIQLNVHNKDNSNL